MMTIDMRTSTAALIACCLAVVPRSVEASEKRGALSSLQQEAVDAVIDAIGTELKIDPDMRGPHTFDVLAVPRSPVMLVRVYGHSAQFGYATELGEVWAWRKGDRPRRVAFGEDDISCGSYGFPPGMVIDTKELRECLPKELPLRTVDDLTLRLRLAPYIPKGIAFGEWPRSILDLEDNAKISQVISPTALLKLRESLDKNTVVSKSPADRCLLIWGHGPSKVVASFVACFRAVDSVSETWSRPVATSISIQGDMVFPCDEERRLRAVPLDAPEGKP